MTLLAQIQSTNKVHIDAYSVLLLSAIKTNLLGIRETMVDKSNPLPPWTVMQAILTIDRMTSQTHQGQYTRDWGYLAKICKVLDKMYFSVDR